MSPRLELLQGTLDMLILQTLSSGEPLHGYAVARSIEAATDDVLKVEEGSLYPALHRIERRGWVCSEWGLSENRRRAKFYRLTPAGRKQLATEASVWSKVSEAIARIMQPA